MAIKPVLAKNTAPEKKPMPKAEKDLDRKVAKFFQSQKLSNKIFTFSHEGKKYKVRLIHNPQLKPMDIGFGSQVVFRYIIAPQEGLPEALDERIFALVPSEQGKFYAGGVINGKKAYDFLV